jgi:hypothetical protein
LLLLLLVRLGGVKEGGRGGLGEAWLLQPAALAPAAGGGGGGGEIDAHARPPSVCAPPKQLMHAPPPCVIARIFSKLAPDTGFALPALMPRSTQRLSRAGELHDLIAMAS